MNPLWMRLSIKEPGQGLDPSALTNKAEVEMKMGNNVGALVSLEKALEREGNWLPAWKLMGEINIMDGDHKKALDTYDHILGIDENYIWGWLGKARTYFEMGKHKKAMSFLDIVLEMDPDLAEANELKMKF